MLRSEAPRALPCLSLKDKHNNVESNAAEQVLRTLSSFAAKQVSRTLSSNSKRYTKEKVPLRRILSQGNFWRQGLILSFRSPASGKLHRHLWCCWCRTRAFRPSHRRTWRGGILLFPRDDFSITRFFRIKKFFEKSFLLAEKVWNRRTGKAQVKFD